MRIWYAAIWGHYGIGYRRAASTMTLTVI
jgi:hypothetical protein